MDPQTQASFIPKKPLVAAAAPAHRGSGGVLWAVSLFLFVVSLIAAGGAFAYQEYLKGAIGSASNSLALAQAAYDPSVINDIIRLDDRINASNQILQNHLAPSAIFNFLEQNTLSGVRFSSFAYAINPDGTASLALSGEALDFSSVALQSDAFGGSKILHDVLFTDINVDPGTGHITFKVTATIDPSLLLYQNELAQLPAASSTAATSGTDATDTAGAPPAAGTASTSTQSTDVFGNPQ